MKVVNGVRTVLKNAPYAVKTKTEYAIKIQVLDEQIKVYINNVPLIDVTDSTYEKGRFGPYSEIPWAEFKNMAYSDLTPISSSAKLQGIAIVGQDMIYSILNSDTANDPMIKDKTNWRYDHLSQKFLDAGDGKSGISSHDGKTYREPIMIMDKVGLYQVNYDTQDDANPDYPYPSLEFDSYRKDSNRAARQLIVHRAPIADYDLGFNPDYTIKWTDRSRDLDRYLTATNYSKEDTGIDYLATKGILQKKFYYITPSGLTVEQKLVTPEEKGEYTVGLAVKDEYDAWSPYLVKKINVFQIPQPDEPPKAGFTLSHKTTYRNVEVTINSTAKDKEDGARENLPHQYYIRNLTEGGFETLQSTVRTSWKKSFNTMGTFQIRQVVEDKLGQFDQFIDTIDIINRLPVVQVTYPSSTDQLNPEKITVAKPTFKWTYADGDGDTMKKYQVRIYRYGGILEQESGILSGAALTWEPDTDLPEKVHMYIMVRAYDGYDWGEWSNPKFFFIETNRPPVPDFDWKVKPIWEGDHIYLINLSTDPDGDAMTYSWSIRHLDKNTETTSTEFEPVINFAQAGTYRVTLNVCDVKGLCNIAPKVKDIEVLPISITGTVYHTETWTKNLEKYNAAAAKAGRAQRPSWYFFPGERFMLRGNTVGDHVVRVDAYMLDSNKAATSYSSNLPGSPDVWNGSMWSKEMIDWDDQDLYFKFVLTTDTGYKKESALVKVRIVDDEYWRQHTIK
ncbi:PKD domain-containing protein [Paenibacillus mendelii]|uniref:PKD domain-containing protein n=1 Tax=Paenibacillus mendelii TaxID=206163 RepID=A0ABV6JEK9_9BACL